MTNTSEQQKKQVSFYAKASDVKSAFYANQPMFILLYKEACFNINELDESLPSVVISLLQEYEDVFPNDVLSGLPPIRGIEHQIDFVPGATIPNHPAYMMGTKAGLILKILCKFQMGQLQDQERRRSRKQCKDWCNPLGMKLERAQQSKWV